jgi:DNA-binding transcriptional regulator GbsR (MarR family)
LGDDSQPPAAAFASSLEIASPVSITSKEFESLETVEAGNSPSSGMTQSVESVPQQQKRKCIPESAGDRRSSALTDVQFDIIDICVRASQALGLPRSIGEIFGLIFSSPRPVSFDDVVQSLGISSGSASHGLRKMCRLGIIRTCYVPRDRRDHYTFEASFRNLALALLEENLLVHVCWADDRIERLKQKVTDDGFTNQTLADRVNTLSNWNAQARSAMKRALETLK